MQLDFVISKIAGIPIDDRKLLIDKQWVSEKTTEFPIQIEIVLRKRSEIEKIEIVAHNKFIPKKLGISADSDDGFIGEVEFRKRMGDDHKFELKNVFLDEKCSKLILNIFEPHIDIVDNVHSLVGLIDIKLFGKYLMENSNQNDDSSSLFFNESEDPKNEIPDQKYSKELKAMIEAIEKNKQKAVGNEDFKMAKMAQLATRQLRKSIKEMEELENDKSEAIEEEDFQRAQDLQDEITALRSNILATIEPRLLENTMARYDEIHRPKNLFEEEGTIPTKPKLYEPVDLSPTEVPADPAHTFLLPPLPRRLTSSSSSASSVKKRPATNSSTIRKSPKPVEIATRPTTTESVESNRSGRRSGSSHRIPSSRSSASSVKRRSSSIGGTNKFLEKENMIVPAALARRRSSSMGFKSPESVDRSTDSITEEEVIGSVPPDNRPNVRSAIAIFGLTTVAKLYSKHFENRKEAIQEIREVIDKMNSEKINREFECINCLIAHILKEPLYNVYKDALLLWHHFCTSTLHSNNLDKFMNRVTSETSEIFASRVVSSEKRIVNETLTTLRDAAKMQHIAKSYSTKFVNSGTKNIKGRAILVELISKLYQVPNDKINLTAETTAQFASKCIRTSDQQVRTIGKDLMLQLYKNGSNQVVRKELDKFANSDPNNPTYQKIAKEIQLDISSRKKKITFKI